MYPMFYIHNYDAGKKASSSILVVPVPQVNTIKLKYRTIYLLIDVGINGCSDYRMKLDNST